MKIILYLISHLLLLVSFQSCHQDSADKTEQKKELLEENKKIVIISRESQRDIGLTLTRVKEENISGELIAPAQLIANQDLEAQVGSFVTGRVSKVFVKLGDHVKRGQELMHIEGLEIGTIKAQFIKARAHLNFTEATVKRQKSLFDQKIGSQKSLIEAQMEYDKALAEFMAEDRKIHSIGLTDNDVSLFVDSNGDAKEKHVSGFLPIKSPIDGIVVERNVVIGQLIEATTNAFRILNTTSLWADGQLHEKDIALIKNNSGITLTTSAYSNEKFPGKIIYIGETVDEHTRTLKVRALIPNPNRKLKPSMFAELHITYGNNSVGMVVPAESVVRDNNETYVFVSLNDTTFERRNIIAGSSQSDLIVVKEGLRIGENIVTKGSFLLKSETKKESFGEEE